MSMVYAMFDKLINNICITVSKVGMVHEKDLRRSTTITNQKKRVGNKTIMAATTPCTNTVASDSRAPTKKLNG